MTTIQAMTERFASISVSTREEQATALAAQEGCTVTYGNERDITCWANATLLPDGTRKPERTLTIRYDGPKDWEDAMDRLAARKRSRRRRW